MVKASTWWWILCVFIGITGGVTAGAGIWIEATSQSDKGLYMLVLSPFLLMFSGVSATIAAKFEQEGR